jgi:hypothetical protein
MHICSDAISASIAATSARVVVKERLALIRGTVAAEQAKALPGWGVELLVEAAALLVEVARRALARSKLVTSTIR